MNIDQEVEEKVYENERGEKGDFGPQFLKSGADRPQWRCLLHAPAPRGVPMPMPPRSPDRAAPRSPDCAAPWRAGHGLTAAAVPCPAMALQRQ